MSSLVKFLVIGAGSYLAADFIGSRLVTEVTDIVKPTSDGARKAITMGVPAAVAAGTAVALSKVL